jgi:hypothetical protein
MTQVSVTFVSSICRIIALARFMHGRASGDPRSVTSSLEGSRMSETKLRQRRRGDEGLMLTCLVVERLCAERVPASVRLEAEIGPVDTQRLVVPLARRLAARIVAAA